MLSMSKDRPSPSPAIVAIMDGAVKLAVLLEDRYGTLAY